MSKMIHREKEQLSNLAKSWNNLDTSFIEKVLANNVTYESQWVFQPMQGKENVLSHLSLKFKAIKATMLSEVMVVSAELASLPFMGDRPCIVLTQMTVEGIRQALVLVKIEDTVIRRIDICAIPNPSEAELTGEFPM
jgi:hypothetical protein